MAAGTARLRAKQSGQIYYSKQVFGATRFAQDSRLTVYKAAAPSDVCGFAGGASACGPFFLIKQTSVGRTAVLHFASQIVFKEYFFLITRLSVTGI